MLPARSFIKVGENLNQEQLSYHYDSMSATSEDKQEEKQKQQEVVSQHVQIPSVTSPLSSSFLSSIKMEKSKRICAKNRYKESTLRREEEPFKSTTVTPLPSTEALNSFRKKNRILSVTLLILTMIISFLLYELHLGKRRERDLIKDVKKLRIEK